MKILVTGYSSKLGKALIESLESQRHLIHLLGRSKPTDWPSANWSPWTLGQNVALLGLPHVDVVVHIAWKTTERRKHFDLNVGGTIQLIDHFKGEGTRNVFISSLAAINPKSYYGLSKFRVESAFSAADVNVIRPGYIIENDHLGNSLDKARIIPNPNQIVNYTHMDCLISKILSVIDHDTNSHSNVVCGELKLSKLLANNARFVPIPSAISNTIFRIPLTNLKYQDLWDKYISLVTTPKIQAFECGHRSVL
jgi:nucleoside-diphosphate-sugar epimerase